MLLSLSAQSCPAMPDATELGFLLHKHPGRAQSLDTSVGTAHVLWPQAETERSTAALLLEVDPVALVRTGRGRREAGPLQQYVNDRPYAASSLLAVALGKAFRTAMTGRCDARPELATAPLPLTVTVPALPARGGPDLVQRLFGPLGWRVEAEPVPLDPQLPGWGDSPYLRVTLSGTLTCATALNQLYVLIPVLDDAKHYWLAGEEVDKLFRAGAGWLDTHPERELITRRYLRHHRSLVLDAVARLAEVDDEPAADAGPEDGDQAATTPEPTRPERGAGADRVQAVLAVLRELGSATVVDVGCGEGRLVAELLTDPRFTSVTGVDVSDRALRAAERRLRLDRMPDGVRSRLRLLQSSVTYRDDRLAGADALVLMEVIEHVDPQRLPALEHVVFGAARPAAVVLTTPNAEYNVRYPGLAPGAFRHPDHRFEWTRQQLADWALEVGRRYGYLVEHRPVGEVDPQVGAPTQLAVLTRPAGQGRAPR